MFRIAITAALFVAFSGPAIADSDEDDLVRLPGQGEVKAKLGGKKGPQRLAPGGGLLVSFDVDENGIVSNTEVTNGITAAFKTADANEDGELTPIEQQDWAKSLPTRDDTLANPTRFDPNLDRVINSSEFASVVETMAAAYANGDGDIEIAALKSKRRPDKADDLVDREELRRQRKKRERSSANWD